jgi:hypothetical protein
VAAKSVDEAFREQIEGAGSDDEENLCVASFIAIFADS